MEKFLNITLSGLTVGFIYAAFALCLVLIFRATRLINFGQGAQAMFTTYIALELINRGASYWIGLLAALVSGFVIGGLVERFVVRPVETGPEINAVIVTLGVFIFFVALAAVVFGNTFESFPSAFSLTGLQVGGLDLALTRNELYNIAAVLIALVLLTLLFQFTSLGLRMRAAAFGQEVARLLGVRVGQMLTLGWALAGLFGSLAGILIAGGTLVSPNYMDGVVVFGFVAAVLGGLDSFIGAVVGGLVLGLTNSYVSGYAGQELITLGALAILIVVLLLKPGGLFASSVARRV
ncbi:MAG: Branched-chain amino acid transporter permease [Frankiales bacterium]|jgi:branched-chain amino acid transport system permease protein|nr:Branched-chain amino acid transporter permease [Frankiales bacterium]